MQQPPNSPGKAHYYYFLFDELKNPVRGTRFTNKRQGRGRGSEYKKLFEGFIKRWKKCVAVGGKHFEGDKIDLDLQT